MVSLLLTLVEHGVVVAVLRFVRLHVARCSGFEQHRKVRNLIPEVLSSPPEERLCVMMNNQNISFMVSAASACAWLALANLRTIGDALGSETQ